MTEMIARINNHHPFVGRKQALTNEIHFIFVPGLRGEGEDVGARAEEDQGTLRQPTSRQSAKVLQNGAGAVEPDFPGM